MAHTRSSSARLWPRPGSRSLTCCCRTRGTHPMRHRIWVMVLLVAAAYPVRAGKPVDLEARARAFLSAVAKDDLATATQDFDDAMKKAFPGTKLRDIWKDLVAKGGAFKKLGGARLGKADKYDIVTVRCEFEKAAYDARVVFDADKR